jgi:hypothetical protein
MTNYPSVKHRRRSADIRVRCHTPISARTASAAFSHSAWLRAFLCALHICILFPPQLARAADQPFRAARSVHLNYPAPEGLFFYNEVVVEQSVNGSYFMACGWNTGYFGIQQLGSADDKVVLFSVWDPTKGNDPHAVKPEDRVEMLYQGDGVRIKRFGGEGTGGQSMWKYNWQPGHTNRFMLGASPEGDKTTYTAWFWINDAWKRLASFRTRTGGRPLGGYYSFIEDFRRDGNSVSQQRRARFGNGWVKTKSGQWVPLTQARFTASNAQWESKENIDAGLDDGAFYLATGGDIKKSCELRSLINLPLVPKSPPEFLTRFSVDDTKP